MRIQFMSRLVEPTNQIHQIVGYAEGDSPFEDDRFVVMLDDGDFKHVAYDSYVSQVRDGGGDVRGLANPYVSLSECVNDSVWRIPNVGEKRAVLMLTRFEGAAAGIGGKKAWTVIGAGAGKFWDQFDERVSSVEGAHLGGKSIFSVPGPDLRQIAGGMELTSALGHPFWGFSSTKMSLPQPYPKQMLEKISRMVVLDSRDLSGERLDDADALELDAFRKDLRTCHLVPSYRTAGNPAFHGYIRDAYARGIIDEKTSVTAEEFDRRQAESVRIQRESVLRTATPQEGAHIN